MYSLFAIASDGRMVYACFNSDAAFSSCSVSSSSQRKLTDESTSASPK